MQKLFRHVELAIRADVTAIVVTSRTSSLLVTDLET
jgi:hypothetical protein